MILIDPMKEFSYELSCIKDDTCRDIAEKAIMKLPQYFWVTPASTSGKYHPVSSLGIGGLVRHTKSAFRIGHEMISHPTYSSLYDWEKDIIRVALLLHDGCKCGESDEGGHSIKEHPLLVRSALKPWSEGEVVTTERLDCWDSICDAIESHMGPWNSDKEGKEFLPAPSSEIQMIVHMADYLASRPVINIDTTDRGETSSFNTVDSQATDSQLSYMLGLIKKCRERNISMCDLGTIDTKNLSKSQASSIIQKLKSKLDNN